MGVLPGPPGRDADPAWLLAGPTEAGGSEVPEPGTVAGGDGEVGKCQTSSAVRQSNQRNTAEETPGKRETRFLLSHLILVLLIFWYYWF